MATTTSKRAAGKGGETPSPRKSSERTATPRGAASAAQKSAPSRAASAAKKAPSQPRAPTQNPAGGLTAAGRKAFAAKDGSHLKPGVTKPASAMTPDEMKRKASWAVRFYGRASLPPLVDANGEPTRFALTAHAWGEKVPKTEADARKIAEKGRRLRARAEKAAAGARTQKAAAGARK